MDTQEAWRKHKASVQQELSEILTQLERLGLDKAADAIRPLAISPENHFGSAGDWEGGILDTGRELSSAADIPQELRLRLQRVVQLQPFNPSKLNPPSAH